MMKNLVGALILFVSLVSVAQSTPQRLPADRLEGPSMAEVLVLGTYHMDNPGRDIFNMEADDVLAPNRQAEIRELLDVLIRFRPTKIAIEADSDSPKIKQYQDYLAGKYELGRGERDQIGFRLGKELNLPIWRWPSRPFAAGCEGQPDTHAAHDRRVCVRHEVKVSSDARQDSTSMSRLFNSRYSLR